MRNLLITIAFAFFLLSPWAGGVLGVRARAIENRQLAEPPVWTRASWLDAEAYAELTAWIEDVMPLRAQAVSLDSWIDYELLGDSPSPKVLIGRGGELFLTDSLRLPCAEDAKLDLGALATVGRVLGRAGVQLYLVLSPNKAFLYPERLPSVGMNACSATARRELRSRLDQPLPFRAVDLWTLFEDQRRRGHRLFPKLNRHWDSYAGILQARGLVEAIQPGLWDDAFVIEEGEATRAAELPSRFMNLEIDVTLPVFRLERPGVEVDLVEFRLTPQSKNPGRRASARSASLPLIPGRTLVFHDSFMEQSIAPFAVFTENAEFIDWTQLYQYPELGARLLARADRLVLQLVEDHAGVELGRHASGILYVLRRYEALRVGASFRPEGERIPLPQPRRVDD